MNISFSSELERKKNIINRVSYYFFFHLLFQKSIDFVLFLIKIIFSLAR